MHVWQAILLGAIQGFAEFLPISSSGHLLLAQRLLGVTDGELFFDVMLHIGTLIPIIIVFFDDIKGLFTNKRKKLLLLIIATIPAGITGVLFSDFVDSAFYSTSMLSALLLMITFLLSAIELYLSEKVQKNSQKALPLSTKHAIVMGIFQGVAILPGLSRSGSVISAGCLTKLNKQENARFAFLMSIPVILGATFISGFKVIEQGVKIQLAPIFFGVLTAALTGYIAIKVMLNVIKKANYKWFSLYLIIMATISLLSKLILGI